MPNGPRNYVYKVTLLVVKVFNRADIWVHGLHINIYELQINAGQLKSKPGAGIYLAVSYA